MPSSPDTPTPEYPAAAKAQRGFTLIELLVVVAVLSLLIGILLPALGKARESAQMVECKSNQRQIVVGLLAHAQDKRGDLCTGPSDNRERRAYGPIDEKGWLADLVLGEYGLPGEMLCPSHPARYNQNLDLSRLNDAPMKPFDEAARDELITKGINSNYCLSWYTAYTGMKDIYSTATSDRMRVEFVRGPLNTKWFGAVAASRVPILGDARTDYDNSFVVNGVLERAVKALTDGPYRRPSRWDRQEYTDWGPAHISAGYIARKEHDKTIGNIAFADGHVESFKDTSGPDGRPDGEFGFRIVSDHRGPRIVYDELENKVFGGDIVSGRDFN